MEIRINGYDCYRNDLQYLSQSVKAVRSLPTSKQYIKQQLFEVFFMVQCDGQPTS
jgi:hypothetical protein